MYSDELYQLYYIIQWITWRNSSAAKRIDAVKNTRTHTHTHTQHTHNTHTRMHTHTHTHTRAHTHTHTHAHTTRTRTHIHTHTHTRTHACSKVMGINHVNVEELMCVKADNTLMSHLNTWTEWREELSDNKWLTLMHFLRGRWCVPPRVETFMFSIMDLFHSSLCALVSGGFTCTRSEPRQTFTWHT